MHLSYCFYSLGDQNSDFYSLIKLANPSQKMNLLINPFENFFREAQMASELHSYFLVWIAFLFILSHSNHQSLNKYYKEEKDLYYCSLYYPKLSNHLNNYQVSLYYFSLNFPYIFYTPWPFLYDFND